MNVDNDRYDRQKRIEKWDQEKIASSKILVVGVGALGNEVVKNLIQIGVRKITILDYDYVVRANLNRCVLFKERDAEEKKLKVEAIKENVKKLNKEVEIITVPKKIEMLGEKFYKNFDFVFGCLDNLEARLQLNAWVYGKGVLIDGGTDAVQCKVQIIKAPGPCLECRMNRNDYDVLWKKYACTGEELKYLDTKSPALPTTTSITAAVQVSEFIKIRLKDNENYEDTLIDKYWIYNTKTNESRILKVKKRKGCPVHL